MEKVDGMERASYSIVQIFILTFFYNYRCKMRMCKNIASRRSYKKEGNFVKVTVDGNSSYQSLAEEAAIALSIEKNGGELILFRVDGTVIPNKDIYINGVCKCWTRGILKVRGKHHNSSNLQ